MNDCSGLVKLPGGIASHYLFSDFRTFNGSLHPRHPRTSQKPIGYHFKAKTVPKKESKQKKDWKRLGLY